MPTVWGHSGAYYITVDGKLYYADPANGGLINVAQSDFAQLIKMGCVADTSGLGLGVNSVALGLTATGTSQMTAFPITAKYNEFTVAPSIIGGAMLPFGVLGDQTTKVANAAANTINVFPNVGCQINSLGVNAPIAVAVGVVAEFWPFSTTQWYSK